MLLRRSAFPPRAARDSGLLLLPTQLQWRGRAGVSPDFPIAQTAPGTELNLVRKACRVKGRTSSDSMVRRQAQPSARRTRCPMLKQRCGTPGFARMTAMIWVGLIAPSLMRRSFKAPIRSTRICVLRISRIEVVAERAVHEDIGKISICDEAFKIEHLHQQRQDILSPNAFEAFFRTNPICRTPARSAQLVVVFVAIGHGLARYPGSRSAPPASACGRCVRPSSPVNYREDNQLSSEPKIASCNQMNRVRGKDDGPSHRVA